MDLSIYIYIEKLTWFVNRIIILFAHFNHEINSNFSCKNFSVEIRYLVVLLGWKGQNYKQNQLDCSTRSTSTL